MKTISIVGFGRVGRALALLLSEVQGEIGLNIMDPWLNPGSYEDICHAHAHRPHRLYQNREDLLSESEVIFHCAGPEVPAGQSRLAVVQSSMELTEQIFGSVQLVTPLVIVVSNPVDIIAYYTRAVSKLDSTQVIGTGTLLDSRRFNILVERELELPAALSQAVLLGEHGDSAMLWRSGSTIGGKPLADSLTRLQQEEILDLTKAQAAYIKEHQGATFYGVANCALTLWKAYLDEEYSVLPFSVEVPESWRVRLGLSQSLYLSLPCRIGKRSLQVLEAKLEAEEWAHLAASARVLERVLPQ